MKLFLNFLSILILSSAFSANAAKVDEIKFSGLESISRGTALNYLPLEVGDEFDQDIAQKVIDELNKTDFFFDVQLNFKNGVLSIKFIENPVIKFIDFKGYENDMVINDEIIEKIKLNYSLMPGKIFSNVRFKKVLSELQQLYSSNAFFDAKFNVKSDLDSQNRVGIEIIFSEGERKLIGNLTISGNQKFDTDTLLDILDMGPPDFFLINYFSEKDHFTRSEFDAALEKIKSKYFSEGYLDFKFEKANVNLNTSTDRLDIEIELSEGALYSLNSIIFKGDLLGFSEDKLRSFFTLKDNDVFKRDLVEQGIRSLTAKINDLGFAFAKVDSTLTFDEKNNALDLLINIDPADKVYLNRIVITGNHKTQDDVIRRKITLNEGQIYSKEDIRNSIGNIRRLGYFSDVNYEIKKLISENDKVDLLIDVVETKTGEISIGLSHSNSTGAAINAGISQQNILGTGNTLKAAFSNSDAIEEISVFFEDPYFNNLGHSISYGFFNKTLDAANLDASSYFFDESGVSFGYGIPLSESSKISGEYKFSSLDLTCGTELKNSYETKQCLSGDDLDSSISMKYIKNTLNDFYFPTNGSRSEIVSTLGLPIADFQYFQIDSSFKSYSPILNNKVFKFSSKLNSISSYGNDEVPFFKRYFGGGASSVRGFDFNSLGAKYANGKPKGGELSFVSSIALGSNVDIIGIDNKNMRISGFLDAGAISEKIKDFSISDIRSSIGAQFTWLTPIGPIGFNIAQPLLKKNDDSTEVFSFELGATF